MDGMLGYDMGSDDGLGGGHTINVFQDGSQTWSGEVVIWNNLNGIHGRRVSGAAPGQWATGDSITLESCFNPGICYAYVYACVYVYVYDILEVVLVC